MAVVVITSQTGSPQAAKATIKYIVHRRERAERITRALFLTPFAGESRNMNHLGVLPAGVGQGEVIEPMLEHLAGNADGQIAHTIERLLRCRA